MRFRNDKRNLLYECEADLPQFVTEFPADPLKSKTSEEESPSSHGVFMSLLVELSHA